MEFMNLWQQGVKFTINIENFTWLIVSETMNYTDEFIPLPQYRVVE